MGLMSTTYDDPAERYSFQPKIDGAPTISVVFPVYNATQFLDASLGSIRAQTLRDIEIICVDDGSTDSSPEVLERHSAEDPRVVVVHQPNRGVYAARNNGLSRARGEFVYFFDSDDILVPEALATAHSAMARDNLDLCLFCAETFYDDKSMRLSHSQFKNRYQLTSSYPGVHTGAELVELMGRNDDLRVVVWLQLVRRELLIRNAIWFRELRVRVDNLFSYLIQTRAERAVCLPDSLVRRRVRAGSLVTTSNHVTDFEGHLTAVVAMLADLCTTQHPASLVSAATVWISWLFSATKVSLHQIPPDQRQLPSFTNPTEAALAAFLYSQALDYSKFLNSPSGRISRAALYLPRKARDLLRSLKR